MIEPKLEPFIGRKEVITDGSRRITLDTVFRKGLRKPIDKGLVYLLRNKVKKFNVLSLKAELSDQKDIRGEDLVREYSSKPITLDKQYRTQIPLDHYIFIGSPEKVMQSGASDRIYIWNTKDFEEFERQMLSEEGRRYK